MKWTIIHILYHDSGVADSFEGARVGTMEEAPIGVLGSPSKRYEYPISFPAFVPKIDSRDCLLGQFAMFLLPKGSLEAHHRRSLAAYRPSYGFSNLGPPLDAQPGLEAFLLLEIGAMQCIMGSEIILTPLYPGSRLLYDSWSFR